MIKTQELSYIRNLEERLSYLETALEEAERELTRYRHEEAERQTRQAQANARRVRRQAQRPPVTSEHHQYLNYTAYASHERGLKHYSYTCAICQTAKEYWTVAHPAQFNRKYCSEACRREAERRRKQNKRRNRKK